MANSGTLETLVAELAAALEPLADAADQGFDAVLALAEEVGVDPTWVYTDASVDAIRTAATQIQQLYGALRTVAQTGEVDPERLADLVTALQDLFEKIRSLDALELAEPDLGLFADFGSALADYLVIRALRRRHPALAALLLLFGIIEERNTTVAFDRLRYARLGQLLTDLSGLLRDVYGWGTTEFRANLFLERLQGALWYVNVPAHLAPIDPAVSLPDVAVDPAELLSLLRIPVLVFIRESGLEQLGVAVTPVSRPGAPGGLGLVPYGIGQTSTELDLGEGWKGKLSSTFDASSPWGVVAGPDGVSVASLGASAPPSQARVRIGIERSASPGEPMLLLGSATGVRLELGRLELATGVEVRAEAGAGVTADAFVELPLKDLRLVVASSDTDSFIASVLPPEGLAATFDATFGFSTRRGFYFQGGGGIDVTVPLHLKLGPVEVQAIGLAAKLDDASLAVNATADFSARLGPVAAAVQGLGMSAKLTFSGEGSGDVGPFGLALGFRPPRGAALSIEAGAVTGGGFLFFDPDKAQYAGGLHLEFEDIVLNANGLLTTRMPDGSRGYSLLVIVQASGFAPIQLGFGFALTGVGGLLGINRTVALDVLRAGVRNRSLDAILFSPDDPTPRAPQILSTLQAVFPPAPGRYVFGPMALITWGAPVPLVTFEIALLLELPTPLRLIVLGRARAALPDADHPLVSIHLDVLGVVDFDKKELSVDATLYDSMIGPFALTGDMAARASWGDRPDFAMALGGFHPAFKPPPGFPKLRRLALSLSTSDNPRLRMETYLALTSNTVQVGARAELSVRAGGFSLEGGLAFDTLIQFSPFRLAADISAHLAIKRGRRTLMGLNVQVHLVGPAPWVAWGSVRFKILFVRFSVSFRATFGRSAAVPALERREVWPALREGLVADGNWSAELPPDTGRLVALRDTSGELLAHPLGTLTISQNLVPLERTIGLFGSVAPKDYDRFAIAGAAGLRVDGPATQYFAPAQFRAMSDAEKLASPSFERMVSGARLAPGEAVVFGHEQETPLDYEQSIILDVDQLESERLVERYTPAAESVAALAEHGPAGTAELRQQGRARFAPKTKGAAVADARYVVVTRDDLTPVELEGLDGTYTSAAERVRRRADRDELQIVRAEELVS
jgi:hypothetical protein